MKSKLHVLVGGAKHFVRWEMPYWGKHFELVDHPSSEAILMAVGPDVIGLGLTAPAKKRYLTTYPGFGHNPLHDPATRARDLSRLPGYACVFINPGPLELAYSSLGNITTFPLSIDVDMVPFRRRTKLNSLLHASNDSPQKDWRRSLEIMQRTGLRHEVFPPRVESAVQRNAIRTKIRLRGLLGIKRSLPSGYVSHGRLHTKMLKFDGFVHCASDVSSLVHLDGKYTATLVEAGLSGALIFWHDTFGLGNGFDCVFSLPLDPRRAADEILEVRRSVNIEKHSAATRDELAAKCSAAQSVEFRAQRIHPDAV